MEAEDMAQAFEKGEAFYASAIHNDPTPDETPESLYWKNLAEVIQRTVPELAAVAFQAKGALYGVARARFLLDLWTAVHDRVYPVEAAQTNVAIVPLPTAVSTSQEWVEKVQEQKALQEGHANSGSRETEKV